MTEHRLGLLRAALRGIGVNGFVVPRADEHLGEYVPPGGERLAWLTGFTGSAGLAIVLPQEAAVFTDGRYTLQLGQQSGGKGFALLHLVTDDPVGWAATRSKRLGYDPWLMSREAVARYEAKGVEMVPVAPNPIDALWQDRPAAPDGPVAVHRLAVAGEAAAAKREAIASGLREAGQDACVLTDSPSVNWLLNIRGSDLEFVPVVLCNAVPAPGCAR